MCVRERTVTVWSLKEKIEGRRTVGGGRWTLDAGRLKVEGWRLEVGGLVLVLGSSRVCRLE